MYKAAIFDLDGTLLDTIKDIADSVNAVLSKLGYHEFSIDEFKYFVGKGVDEMISAVIKKGEIDPLLFHEIKSGYMEQYALRHSVNTKPYPGIIELLKNLMNLGTSLCILSNKPHFQTETVVEKYFKGIDFEIIFGKKPEFEIKPNPGSANEIVKQLGVEKEQVLYIGDTNTDIQTAKNAKLDSVGVLWGFRKRAELENEGACWIVQTPSEILKIIRGDTQ